MEAITLTGGTFLEDPSDYFADGYIAVMENDLWRVRLGQAEQTLSTGAAITFHPSPDVQDLQPQELP